jgi:hypothetical protein
VRERREKREKLFSKRALFRLELYLEECLLRYSLTQSWNLIPLRFACSLQYLAASANILLHSVPVSPVLLLLLIAPTSENRILPPESLKT